MENLKCFDIVTSLGVEGLPDGTEGTIVYVYDDGAFEVEFVGNIVITVTEQQIIKKYDGIRTNNIG